ncbi:MAG: LTA synthase family protein [Candidatus Avelusimicrobium sp.]|uniref:LTA synthase family protein n=1 Tax=Candidatus Avelusimicrobium sp. TaxID=3048833 RepID=UPI003F01D707
MTKRTFVPGWIKSYFTFIAANWLVFTIFRVIFLFVFRAALLPANYHELWETFYIGAKFDARLACALAIPLGLFFGLCLLFRVLRKFRGWMAAFYGLLEAAVLLVYFADFAHYAYIAMRINYSIFKYSENALISLQMAWETYPLVWAVIGLLLWGLGWGLWVNRLQKKAFENGDAYYWKGRLAWFFGGLLATAALMFGQISQYPLRWSNAYHSTNNFICNLTLNPALNIFDTARFVKADSYDKEKTAAYYDEVAKYLGVQNPDKEKLNFGRTVTASASARKDYNVVVIFMESLAWNKISMTNPDIDPTPFVKELADRSILFTHFFAPTSATARAVFATVTSIPDVTSFKTSSRNPLVVDQHLVVNALTDYEKYYFIGGSASWGNIRGILEHNLAGVHMYEEGAFENEHRNDVWGISDLDLFREADRVLTEEQKELKKPFFAFIQTSGYHRPYTIPDDNAGFESKDIGAELAHKRSFVSVEEYNSLRFSDHALREFFKLVEKQDWYENTIFFIFGDHGLAAPQSENMPRGYVDLNLINHQIPLIITGGPIKKARVIDDVASQVDILPTAMGLLGRSYTTRAIGRDVLAKDKPEPGALVYGWAVSPSVIGFVQGDYYYHSQGGKEGLYKYKADNYNEDISAKDPERFEHMKNLAQGLYETSRYQFYHNQKKTEQDN